MAEGTNKFKLLLKERRKKTPNMLNMMITHIFEQHDERIKHNKNIENPNETAHLYDIIDPRELMMPPQKSREKVEEKLSQGTSFTLNIVDENSTIIRASDRHTGSRSHDIRRMENFYHLDRSKNDKEEVSDEVNDRYMYMYEIFKQTAFRADLAEKSICNLNETLTKYRGAMRVYKKQEDTLIEEMFSKLRENIDKNGYLQLESLVDVNNVR